MAGYRKILVVVDLSEDSDLIAARARVIAACYDSQLLFLHVVEFVPVEPMGETLLPAVQIEEELMQRARVRLRELTAGLNLPSCECFVEAGNIKAEILRVAQEQSVDLIVLGSRERHGLAILLNFTEDTVLHSAPCDVLAVRLHG
jgi:universal stress protein A